MSDTIDNIIFEIAKHLRLRATAKEQLALTVMNCPEFDDVKFMDIDPEIKTKGKRLIYEFDGIVDRGEFYDTVGFTVTLTRYANGSIVAWAVDDTDLCGGEPQSFGPGTLADVVDQIGFEHGGEHCNIMWTG